MKNHVKSLLTGAMLIIMLASTALTSFALPMNTDITDSYIYDYYGEAVKAPVAYKADKVISATDLKATVTAKDGSALPETGVTWSVDKEETAKC